MVKITDLLTLSVPILDLEIPDTTSFGKIILNTLASHVITLCGS